ncbi:unnamed protein product [Ectocarpus fasciculatus]
MFFREAEVFYYMEDRTQKNKLFLTNANANADAANRHVPDVCLARLSVSLGLASAPSPCLPPRSVSCSLDSCKSDISLLKREPPPESSRRIACVIPNNAPPLPPPPELSLRWTLDTALEGTTLLLLPPPLTR